MAHCYLGMNQGTQLRQLFALYLQGVNYIKMVFHYKTMQPYMYGSYVASGCRCLVAGSWPLHGRARIRACPLLLHTKLINAYAYVHGLPQNI